MARGVVDDRHNEQQQQTTHEVAPQLGYQGGLGVTHEQVLKQVNNWKTNGTNKADHNTVETRGELRQLGTDTHNWEGRDRNQQQQVFEVLPTETAHSTETSYDFKLSK